MSYEVLAQKWRPQNFNDVVGQAHVTTTLKNQILSERVGHAYLFWGPRGTGKTTVARILAKQLTARTVFKKPDLIPLKPRNLAINVYSVTTSHKVDPLMYWRWMPPRIAVLIRLGTSEKTLNSRQPLAPIKSIS